MIVTLTPAELATLHAIAAELGGADVRRVLATVIAAGGAALAERQQARETVRAVFTRLARERLAALERES